MRTTLLRYALMLGFSVAPTNTQMIAHQIDGHLISADAASFPAYELGDTVDTILSQRTHYDTTQNTFILVQGSHEEPSPGHAADRDPNHALKDQLLNCDAIVLATPVKRQSALTANRQFIFSEYDATIQRVLSSSIAGLSEGQQIVLSRAGGALQVDGQQIRAIDPEFPLFRLNERYIFFLKFLPASGSFRVVPSDAYLIQDGTISAARNHSKILPAPTGADQFMNTIERSLSELGVNRW